MWNLFPGLDYKVTPSWELLLWNGDVWLPHAQNKWFLPVNVFIKNGFIRWVSALSALMSTLTQLYNRWLYWEQICDLASGVRESVYAVSTPTDVAPDRTSLTTYSSIYPFIHSPVYKTNEPPQPLTAQTRFKNRRRLTTVSSSSLERILCSNNERTVA